MSEIVYTSIMEIKQLSKQHGCKVCVLTNGLNSCYVYHVYDDYDYDRVTILPINTNIDSLYFKRMKCNLKKPLRLKT